MATTAQHLAARSDEDLIMRLVAAAETAGVPDAENWVHKNIGALITAPVSAESTIADVHGYASFVRQQAIEALPALPPLPGVDPAAVTDAFLAAAVADVLN